MPRIADYSVIRDTKFTLQLGADIDQDFDFTLESGAHPGSPSILSFVLFVSTDSNNLAFEVKINGSQQLSYSFTGFQINTLHEVINANVLKAGTNNIEFRVTGGTGALQFGDVVLFYQRDI
jgi:hypothetical protein